MKELEGLLHLETKTVTGKSLGENLEAARVMDHKVIRPFSDPYTTTGGITVLFGNLAPNGAVVKSGAVAPEMLVHRGTATSRQLSILTKVTGEADGEPDLLFNYVKSTT